jgi:hypothetical protein
MHAALRAKCQRARGLSFLSLPYDFPVRRLFGNRFSFGSAGSPPCGKVVIPRLMVFSSHYYHSARTADDRSILMLSETMPDLGAASNSTAIPFA